MKKYIRSANLDLSDATEHDLVDVASRPNLRIGTLRELARSKYWVVRGAVALNKTTPVELLKELSKDDNIYVLRAVCNNPNTPRYVKEQLYKLGPPEFKECLGSDTDTDPEILAWLSLDMSKKVRMAVAKNTHTPGPVLADMSRESAWFEHTVAGNPGAPEYLLRKLGHSVDAETRKEVAANPSTPMDLLLELVNDPVPSVSHNAYYNNIRSFGRN